MTVGVVVSICGAAGWSPLPRVGGIAGAVLDGRPVEIERRSPPGRRCSARRHRVAEGQRIGAGAAGIGRGAAVVERQRRRAAGNRHRLAQVQGQRDHVAGIEIAIAARGRSRCQTPPPMTRRAVVSICGCRSGGHRSRKLAALPAPSLTVAPLRLNGGRRQVGGVLPGATV